jgi:basic amino acid/polyamine antiporter, APA family
MSTSSLVSDKGAVQDQELVKGLGLTSATTIVMGSMIGSGIFIVSADIARLVDSPALLIAAWLVTGFMTIVGALSYGELAAMMPRAGGQYVYLREAFGPLWGFLYGWTLFTVIQTGTIAAVGVAFGKFLGHFIPAVSGDSWIFRVGTTNIGLNYQNLTGILGERIRSKDRRSGAEHLYLCENCRPTGSGGIGIHRGPQSRGGGRELLQFLAKCRSC